MLTKAEIEERVGGILKRPKESMMIRELGLLLGKAADEIERLQEEKPCYAVFIQPRKKNRSIDPPCLDPLDYGEGKEPDHEQLLRRGRVGLFASREDAEAEILATCEANKGAEFVNKFGFLILECRDHRPGT
jgi:hypothetical protein